MTSPELERSEPLPGHCNATDGFSVCTNPDPGHGPVHWDRRTQHEWHDENEEG
jgi:hypothetical protein